MAASQLGGLAPAVASRESLSQQTDAKLSDHCDVHDLTAVVSSETGKVLIYRGNGQIAFSIDRKNPDARITALKWKPDGRLLSIGWEDGSCTVHSGEDGKLLSQSNLTDDPLSTGKVRYSTSSDGHGYGKTAVCCLIWASYNPDARNPTTPAVAPPKEFERELTTEDWYDGSEANSSNEHRPDIAALADSIATMDITSVLPTLSALPAHALRLRPDEQKFTSQAGLDTLMETAGRSSGSISTLTTIGTSGNASVYLENGVRIGGFRVSPSSYDSDASLPQCMHHGIHSASQHNGPSALRHIELPLEKLGGSLLRVVATNTRRMQTIAAYIVQTVRCIHSDFETNLQLPRRLVNNISEELAEKQEGDLVTNLYHLAMTGTFTPTILEWLADTVKENTHKRWDKHIKDMYNHVQTHLIVNLIPALNRLDTATNVIRNHARFHEHTGKFVPSHPFTALLDDIDSMRSLAQKLLLITMTEHKQFRAFSKWLRVMIDIGVAGPGSKAAAEIEEREVPNLDDSLSLAYIKDTLMRSELATDLEQNLDDLVARLGDGTDKAIASITDWNVA